MNQKETLSLGQDLDPTLAFRLDLLGARKDTDETEIAFTFQSSKEAEFLLHTPHHHKETLHTFLINSESRSVKEKKEMGGWGQGFNFLS